MDFSGEQVLAAPRQAVWEALNDPAVLAACLPGCQRFDPAGDDVFVATVGLRIGSLAATFSGTLTLAEVDPGRAITLAGQGQGGIAGFARGTARVTLADHPGGTRLDWSVTAEIGGRLASLGGRLLHAFAASSADTFFTQLASRLS